MIRQTLFEIGSELQALNDLLTEIGGDITDAEVDAAIASWFAEIGGNEAAKLDGYVGLIRQNEMEAAAAKAEAEQWQAKTRARENTASRLKSRLKLYLELTGRTKAVTATGRTIGIQANGGKVPLIVADPLDPNDVPLNMSRYVFSLNTEAVREALEQGVELTFAKLGERGTQLRVR